MNKNEARVRIAFPEASHEAFANFADEVAAELPEVEVTYQDKPMIGKPYVIIKNTNGHPWGHWTLIVDIGQELCISDNNTWVAYPPA